MNTIEDRPVEDRLKAAIRAYVPDQSAPPLRLTPRRTLPARRPGRDGAGAGWRWQRARGWAVPLAAAAAVVAVVAASLAIARGGGGPAANHANHPAAAAQPGSPPPYYVASWVGSGSNNHGYVQVRATNTGALEATVRLPRPYTYVPGLMAAAGDDRAFLLLATSPTGSQQLFLLRFTPHLQAAPASATQLTPLAIPIAEMMSPHALSPNGTMLATTSTPQHGPGTLTVYNLVTGAKRTRTGWTPPAGSAFSALAWSADGRWLQYCWGFGATQRIFFGRLDPSAPGTTLPTPTESITAPAGTQGLRLLTDGHLSVLVVSRGRWLVEILSPRGGAPVVIPLPAAGHGQPPSAHLAPAWSSDTGETMILQNDITPMKIGVFSGGHFRPLPLAPAFRQSGNTSLLW